VAATLSLQPTHHTLSTPPHTQNWKHFQHTNNFFIWKIDITALVCYCYLLLRLRCEEPTFGIYRRFYGIFLFNAHIARSTFISDMEETVADGVAEKEKVRSDFLTPKVFSG
jgi:hypothetical protein